MNYNSNELKEYEINLSPEDYIIEGKNIKNNIKDIDKDFLGLLKEECQLAFMPIDVPPPRGPLFVFGEYFLRKFYTVFDRDRKLVGFSLANHMNSNNQIQDDVLIQTPYDDVDTDEITVPRKNNFEKNEDKNNLKFKNNKQIFLDFSIEKDNDYSLKEDNIEAFEKFNKNMMNNNNGINPFDLHLDLNFNYS